MTNICLTHKERVRRALQYQPLDRIPTQINYTANMGKKMAEYFNVAIKDLPGFLDNHFVRVDINWPKNLSKDGNVTFDWWGVGFSVNEEGYFVSTNPLAETKDLDTYSWPDPDDIHLLSEAERVLKEDAGQHFITPNFGFALFERAWALRGLDAFMMDMALDPAFAEYLLDRILNIQLKLIHRFIDLGVDGGYFGDDYGAQKNMLFSPKMWRKFIKPRLARMFTPFLEIGLPVLMHSDGQIQAIIPDLIEIGLTALNPIQPEVLDHAWLRKEFSGRLAYYGGVSTQSVLPNGSPDDVKRAVRNCIQELTIKGTGLVIAPSHRLMTDIPLENIEAMLSEFNDLRS